LNQQEKIKREMKKTISFYQEFLDPELTEEEVRNLYDVKCYPAADQYSVFTKGLRSLASLFSNPKFSPDMLYDDEGNLLDNKDLLQLMLAPKCLHSENRKKLDFQFTCEGRGPN